jgi:uncharacterized membrane protein
MAREPRGGTIVALLKSQVSDPHKFRRLNGILTVFWLVMIPVSFLLGLTSVVAFVSILSLYANFATHLGAWAASRTEARQVETADIKADTANVQANDVNATVSPNDGSVG